MKHNSTCLFPTFREGERGGGYFRIVQIGGEWFWQIDASDELQAPVKIVGPFTSAEAACDNAYWS